MTITSLSKLYDHHEFDICSLPLLSVAHVNLFKGFAHLTCMYLNSSQSVYFHSSALLNLFVLVSLKDIGSSLVFSFYLQINHTMLLFSLPCNPNPLTNFHRILLVQLYILSMLTHCISPLYTLFSLRGISLDRMGELTRAVDDFTNVSS